MYEKFPRTDWFRHDRFGMFIHFGLYAIPARGEWARGTERIPDDLYYSYFKQFNPYAFNAREWAKAAKNAGMKYMVVTAKHHDGFCLFDSKLTDFKITNTPFGRDLIKEYVEAAREEGLKVGIYYSIIDWNHPAYPAYHHHSHPHRFDEDYQERRPFDEYLDYMHGQVRELCTNYGKIDIMWFDYSYGEMTGETWRATELMKMVRSLQPGIITDNRLEVGGESYGSLTTGNPSPYSGDFVSPEQIIPPKGIVNELGEPIPWEACITMNEHWGYASEDFNYKNDSMVIRKLLECVSKGGNMILNIGPDATGRFPEESVKILEKIGKWMDRYSEAVVGCGLSEFDKPEWGRYTQNGDTVYACVTEPPVGPLALLGIPADRIEYVRDVKDGTECKILSDDWRINRFTDIAFIEPKDLRRYEGPCSVFKIKLK